ncbi:MAG: GNAT family N-acetyltransferase, partial [bacterium]
MASEDDRASIYSMRHEVYARELRQHPENADKALSDALDRDNVYVVVTIGETLAGFVSITPPGNGVYSIDKYLRRDEIPFLLDSRTYEIRILTVAPEHRGGLAAALLMYGALRWVEAHGGSRIIAIGRREVREIYVKAGLQSFGREFVAGSVHFTPMTG